MTEINSNKKIRVALMTYSMDNRPAKGSALYTRKLIENIRNDPRFEFTFVHYEKTDDPLYRNGEEIILPHVSLPLPYGSRFLSQMIFYWKYRKQKFDVIHWFQPRLYPFFWFAPAHVLIATFYGGGDITAPSFFSFSKKIYNWTSILFNSFLDVIIAGSEFGKKEIIQAYHANPDKVVVSYLGGGENYSALDKYKSLILIKEKYDILGEFILNVGRLQPHKNTDTLIKAYILMREKYPERIEKLVIVAKPTFGQEKTYLLAKDSIYKDDIIFIDYVDNEYLNTMYSAAKLFVFPSMNEGFGLPVLEAMASGTPVITTTATSLPELSGDAAILFDPYDVEKLTDNMNAVLSNVKLQEELIIKGKIRASQFTWLQTGTETLKIYEKHTH